MIFFTSHYLHLLWSWLFLDFLPDLELFSFNVQSAQCWQTLSFIVYLKHLIWLMSCIVLSADRDHLIYLYCLNDGAETSFHIGIYRHYGGYYICVNGASQLHSLCFLLCASGIVWTFPYIIFKQDQLCNLVLSIWLFCYLSCWNTHAFLFCCFHLMPSL